MFDQSNHIQQQYVQNIVPHIMLGSRRKHQSIVSIVPSMVINIIIWQEPVKHYYVHDKSALTTSII